MSPRGGALILGHRGAPKEVTENTMASFERAISHGADGVECDLQITRDGVVIVFHDPDLVRLFDLPGRIADTDYDVLAKLKLPCGQSILRFEDLLANWSEEHWLDLELKSGPVSMVKSVLDLLGDRPNTFVSSFNIQFLESTRVNGYTGELAILLSRKQAPYLHADGGRSFGCDSVVLHAELCSAHRVAHYHGMGSRVSSWGARNVQDERRLESIGIDRVITDYPRAIL